MKEVLITINNELQQIYVRGIDTVHMANALNMISQLINTLPDEDESDTIEQRGDENE